MKNCVLILSLTWLAATTAWSEDSRQFRGNNRDGKSAEKGLWTNIKDKPPELAWMAEGIGKGYASVSVVGDRIYTSGNTGKGQAIFALSATDGKIAWTTMISGEDPKHGYDGSRTTPTVDGDRLYVVGSSGSIVCLNTADGKEIWSRDFSDFDGKMMSGWGFSESPSVSYTHLTLPTKRIV